MSITDGNDVYSCLCELTIYASALNFNVHNLMHIKISISKITYTTLKITNLLPHVA